MKKAMSFTIIFFLGLTLGHLTAIAEGEKNMGAPITHSKDFERMKGLVGVWEGTADMGKGPQTVRATYELTSAGNAIVEKLFAGTSHEMVTVYHDYMGKLAMTHYCSLGNQPHMELMNASENTMEFILSQKTSGISSVQETHMHALKITFDGKDAITHTWTLYEQGKKKSDVMIKLVRVKA